MISRFSIAVCDHLQYLPSLSAKMLAIEPGKSCYQMSCAILHVTSLPPRILIALTGSICHGLTYSEAHLIIQTCTVSTFSSFSPKSFLGLTAAGPKGHLFIVLLLATTEQSHNGALTTSRLLVSNWTAR